MTDLSWTPYRPTVDHTVVGTVRESSELHDERLHGSRTLSVYLPPSYDRDDRRYPVLYMHDGQNLFDEGVSYSGEWTVDESMEALAEEGREAIVVGIPNANDDRGAEYTPFAHPEYGGGDADAYLSVLVDHVKPLVDETFRTEPGRDSTGLAGSSLGGLVSLYAFFEYPETFGFAGAMSPAFWWCGEAFFEDIDARPFEGGRLYVDVGGRESTDDEELRRRYVEDAERMVALLREKGYDESRLQFVFEEEARHHESAWAERFPEMVRQFLD